MLFPVPAVPTQLQKQMSSPIFYGVFFLLLSFFTLVHVNHAFAQENAFVQSQFTNDKFVIYSEEGKGIVSFLKDTMPEGNTTSCRREQKAVISLRTWRMIKNELLREKPSEKLSGVRLVSRDQLPKGGKNSTFTYYGKGAKFSNEGVDTVIRMRLRFYLEIYEKLLASGQKLNVRRSDLTAKRGYLEIKIKNPTAKEPMGVHKYRVLMVDEDILQLIFADPFAPAFDSTITELAKRAKLQPENNPAEVDAVMAVVARLSQNDPSFKIPQFAVSYERTAYKHVEPQYSFIMPTTGEKKSSDIEYQMTLDKNITYYRPRLQQSLEEDFAALNLEEYYKHENRPQMVIGKYPSQALALEFKDPFPVASLDFSCMSNLHRMFCRDFIASMHSPIFIMKSFVKNKGKAAHLPLIAGTAKTTYVSDTKDEDEDIDSGPIKNHKISRKRMKKFSDESAAESKSPYKFGLGAGPLTKKKRE